MSQQSRRVVIFVMCASTSLWKMSCNQKFVVSLKHQMLTISCVIGLSILFGCSSRDMSTIKSDTTVSSSIGGLVSVPLSTVPAAPTGGPKSPSCGLFRVTSTEVIAGQTFLSGQYQINTFGISCDEVMGDTGLFSQFLKLDDNEELPKPWRYLEGAVGAPKFVSEPSVGFRAQRISD